MKPIQRAIKEAGGPTKLSRALGVAQPTVSNWASGKRPVPSGQCVAIEKAVNGAVTCEELRPDINWDYMRETAA